MTAPYETTLEVDRADRVTVPSTGHKGRSSANQGSAASEPIQPVPGQHLAISAIQGLGIVATRETVRDLPDPAIRIFTGDIAGRTVGDTFESHHKVNRMPCGTWTIIATVTSGRLTGGHLPEGTGKLRVNKLG